MRIWIVNHYAVPPTQAGGTRHYAFARHLIQRGHEVAIVASSLDYYAREDVHLAPREVWRHEVLEGVRFIWLRTPPYQGNSLARARNMAAFAALVWRGIGTVGLAKPDVIVGSSPHLFAALAAEKVARRFRVSFVLEVRDLWPQTLVDFGLYSTNHPVVRVLESIERRLYRGAERIIVLSPGAVDYMIRKGVSDGRVVWLPNGVDLGLVPEPTIPGTGETFTVMYAGAHGIANGLDTVLDAAAILQEDGWGARVRFRLIGDGLEKPRLESRVRRESLKAVFLEPPVPKSQIYRLLQDADALIFTLKKSPIYRWGFSLNKLFDYFASARPIICAADSPYDPVTETNAGLTVPSEDPLAIAQAVKRLAQMPSVERWRMGLRGRSYVEEHHDLSQLTDKFEEILYDAITARHAFA